MLQAHSAATGSLWMAGGRPSEVRSPSSLKMTSNAPLMPPQIDYALGVNLRITIFCSGEPDRLNPYREASQ